MIFYGMLLEIYNYVTYIFTYYVNFVSWFITQ